MGSLCSLLPCRQGQVGSGDRQPFTEGHGCSSLSRTDVVAEEVILGSPNPRHLTTPRFFPMIWRHELNKSLGQPHGRTERAFPTIPGSLCEQRLTALLRARRVVQLLWAPSQCSSEYTSCPTASSFTLLIHSPLLHTHLFCALGRGMRAQGVWAPAPWPVRRSHTSVWGGRKPRVTSTPP